MKDRIVKLARPLQRPERRALCDQAVDIGRRSRIRRLDRDRCDACATIDVDADKAITDAGLVDGAIKRRERDALAVAVALRACREFFCALGDPGLQLAVRSDL